MKGNIARLMKLVPSFVADSQRWYSHSESALVGYANYSNVLSFASSSEGGSRVAEYFSSYEVESVSFSELPSSLKERLYAFDAGGVYARAIFPHLPSRHDADFEIIDGGRKLLVKPRRKLLSKDFRFVGILVFRAGASCLHLLSEVGELVSG